MPANDLAEVKRLAGIRQLELFLSVVAELECRSLDSDDLVEILVDRLSEEHWFKSVTTLKYFPGTTSDCYSVWVDECGAQMYVKLLISDESNGSRRLRLTSFKRDNRYVGRTMRRVRRKRGP